MKYVLAYTSTTRKIESNRVLRRNTRQNPLALGVNDEHHEDRTKIGEEAPLPHERILFIELFRCSCGTHVKPEHIYVIDLQLFRRSHDLSGIDRFDDKGKILQYDDIRG